MTRKARLTFAFACFITLDLFIAVNLLAAHLQSDCGLPALLGLSHCADDIRRAGFPLLFWEEGGFAYRSNFEPANFLFDIGLAVIVSVIVGVIAERLSSQVQESNSP